ncbi:hypothetical protein M0R45_007207 [Rubus argutus]|uniref:Uncharacterized protein n=1 Tax=Rubus argutus TaxID=59490 RepID=A0AAW1XXI2_RUBAR
MSHSHTSLWANANLVSARRVSNLQSNNKNHIFLFHWPLRGNEIESRLRGIHHQLDLVVQDDLHSFLQSSNLRGHIGFRSFAGSTLSWLNLWAISEENCGKYH